MCSEGHQRALPKKVWVHCSPSLGPNTLETCGWTICTQMCQRSKHCVSCFLIFFPVDSIFQVLSVSFLETKQEQDGQRDISAVKLVIRDQLRDRASVQLQTDLLWFSAGGDGGELQSTANLKRHQSMLQRWDFCICFCLCEFRWMVKAQSS